MTTTVCIILWPQRGNWATVCFHGVTVASTIPHHFTADLLVFPVKCDGSNAARIDGFCEYPNTRPSVHLRSVKLINTQ